MERCKDCLHWSMSPEDDYGVGAGIRVRKCAAVPLRFDATEWARDESGNVINVLKKGYEGTTAFCEDASDYRADLYTTADHGCTMFRRHEGGEIGKD